MYTHTIFSLICICTNFFISVNKNFSILLLSALRNLAIVPFFSKEIFLSWKLTSQQEKFLTLFYGLGLYFPVRKNLVIWITVIIIIKVKRRILSVIIKYKVLDYLVLRGRHLFVITKWEIHINLFIIFFIDPFLLFLWRCLV